MRIPPDRRQAAGTAATLIGGSAELIDFLIPLWGGTPLGLAPSATTSSRVFTEATAELSSSNRRQASICPALLSGKVTDSRARPHIAITLKSLSSGPWFLPMN